MSYENTHRRRKRKSELKHVPVEPAQEKWQGVWNTQVDGLFFACYVRVVLIGGFLRRHQTFFHVTHCLQGKVSQWPNWTLRGEKEQWTAKKWAL